MTEQLRQDLSSLRIDRERAAPRRRWPWWAAAGAALLAAAFGVVRLREAGRGVEVRTVRAAVAPAGEAPTGGAAILSASGYVVPRRKAVVSAKIQGRLADLRVEEGSRVRADEVLARLESADYAARVGRARAALQRSRADLEEQRRQQRLARALAREGVVSADALEAADSRVRIAEAALAQAEADLSLAEAEFRDTIIRAPFDGTVVKKMAEVGESVAPIPPGVNISTSSGAIVAIADLQTLEVETDIGESSVARLAPGQPAEVVVEAFADRRYRGVLRQIIPTADRTKATVQVKVTIVDRDDLLRPEMTARVTFVEPAAPAAAGAPPAPAVTVPREAIAERDGRDIVFEVRDGRARLRPVVTGAAAGGRVVVREGLAGFETLVARPPDTLQDGDAVRVLM